MFFYIPCVFLMCVANSWSLSLCFPCFFSLSLFPIEVQVEFEIFIANAVSLVSEIVHYQYYTICYGRRSSFLWEDPYEIAPPCKEEDMWEHDAWDVMTNNLRRQFESLNQLLVQTLPRIVTAEIIVLTRDSRIRSRNEFLFSDVSLHFWKMRVRQ